MFQSVNKLFGRKNGSDDLGERAALLVEESFIEAVSETLKSEKAKLEHLLTSVLPSMSAVLAGNLVINLFNLFLHALVTKEHNSEIQRSLKKLIANPRLTGIGQLQMAMKLEKGITTEGGPERDHRVKRYQDALNSFDKALPNASDDEKIQIYLYSAIASAHIPGAAREARIQFLNFQAACNLKANAIHLEAEEQDNLAVARRKEADAIDLSLSYRGAGGGLIGMSEAVNPNKKMELQLQIRKHETKAEELRAKSRRFRNCIQIMEFILRIPTAAETEKEGRT